MNNGADLDTLAALCRRIVPAAFDANPPIDLVAAVQIRIATLPPAQQEGLRTAIRLFGHPLAGLVDVSFPARFSALDPARQDARLHAWDTSSIPLRRTIFQALRRLVVATYYSIPETYPDIGYRGPLRNRDPVVGWEGPLPERGESADGVIASVTMETVGAGTATHRVRAPSRGNGVIAGADLRSSSELTCDAVVIGSGAGGAVAAARLAEAGHSVIVLEEGGYYSTADFTDSERDMMPRLYADAGARATDDAAISLLQGRCVGGGSTVNWMLMLRPRAWVMEEWETEHHASLLGAASLVPALERIETEVRAGFLPDDAHSPSNRVILDGAAALGWSAEAARINARGCVRAGTCGLGCSHGAKRSAGEVFLPRAIAAGARVVCDARVDRIERTTARKRVHCTIIDRTSGLPLGALSVSAAIVVIAGGAIGTPALLQRSGMAGGAVGSWLRLHPTTAVRGLYDRVMYGAAGVPQSVLLSQFMHHDDGYGFWIECPPMLPSLAAVATGGFGHEHRSAMLQFPNVAALIVLTRDGALRTHSSGSVRVDRKNRIRIQYETHPADRAHVAQGIAAAARLHFAAGAREVTTLHTPSVRLRSADDLEAIASASLAPNRIALFSAHVNGTCRMGGSARTSGCDPDGQRHGEAGIYVADGSVFPTAPGVNPQAAIMALSSLIAERAAARI